MKFNFVGPDRLTCSGLLFGVVFKDQKWYVYKRGELKFRDDWIGPFDTRELAELTAELLG